MEETTIGLSGCPILGGAYYKNGDPLTDFIVNFSGLKERQEKGQKMLSYLLKIVKATGETAQIEVTAQELNCTDWTKNFPFLVYVPDKRSFLSLFNQGLAPIAAGAPLRERTWDCIGLVNDSGIWRFLFSNGCISKDGFCQNIKSQKAGYRYMGTRKLRPEMEKECICQFIRPVLANARVYIPLFLLNLLAIMREPFRMIGIDTGLTLWLYGESGAGKTELSKAMAAFAVMEDLPEKNFLSVTDSKRETLRRLAESNGNVVVLDDVRKVKVQASRDSIRNSVDIVLRSIFQGILIEDYAQEELQVSTCALINGEYMETDDSQNARLLYLDVSGFLKEGKNSESLRVLQRNPGLLASVIGGFIRWLCGRLEDAAQMEEWREEYFHLQDLPPQYAGIKNGNRLQENGNRILFAGRIWIRYMESLGLGDFLKKTDFEHKMENGLAQLIDDTALLLGGFQTVVRQLMEAVIRSAFIRRCAFVQEFGAYHCGWQQAEFCLWEDDDFILLEDVDRSWVSERREQPAIVREALVMETSKFKEKLNFTLEAFIEAGQIPERFRERLSLMSLAEQGIICCGMREGGGYRTTRYYPKACIKEEEEDSSYDEDYDEDDYGYIGDIPRQNISFDRTSAVEFNLSHMVFAGVLEGKISEQEKSGELSPKDCRAVISLRKAFFQGKVVLGEQGERGGKR